MNTTTMKLHANDAVTRAFVERGCNSFADAADLVASLSYSRNRERLSLLSPLIESCGTCSTKHVLLYALACANGWDDHIQLCIGIYRMHAGNTPKIGAVLEAYQLPEIPEAHCYLRINNEIADFTSAQFSLPFEPDLLEEHVLHDHTAAMQLKPQLHKACMMRWAAENNIAYSIEQLWAIREQCIAALS